MDQSPRGQPEPPSPPLSPVPPDPGFPDVVLRHPRGVGGLNPFWRELAPRLSPERIDLAAGQYTMTPDHKPLIGPAAETAGLWLHTGYSGHGSMGSPSGGRLLADLLAGRLADADNPFRPGRFADGVAPAAEAMLLSGMSLLAPPPDGTTSAHGRQTDGRRPPSGVDGTAAARAPRTRTPGVVDAPATTGNTRMDELDQPGLDDSVGGDGRGPRDVIAAARRALEPVQAALTAAGFYAYGTIDDQHRWTIAADDEAGHVDVRVGLDGYEVELWTTSPGLYAEEENEFRRRALERLARMTIPNIARGFLAPHQSASWDEVDHGVAVRIRYELPFTRAADVGDFVRQKLPELEELLGFVETQVTS